MALLLEQAWQWLLVLYLPGSQDTENEDLASEKPDQQAGESEVPRSSRSVNSPATMPVSHAAQSRLSSSRLHAGTRVVQSRRCLQRPRYSCTPRAGLTEVGKYLAEAASCMLQPQADTVPWSGGRLDFWPLLALPVSCERYTAAASACICATGQSRSQTVPLWHYKSICSTVQPDPARTPPSRWQLCDPSLQQAQHQP